MNATTTTHDAVKAFYDTLAPDYDVMTNFETRFEAERPVFRSLVERYSIATALDAGCGTGFHSLLLAQIGVQVTGVDVSPKMLAALRRTAEEMNVTVRTMQCAFEEIPDMLTTRFDAVFCLGNSLAHLLTEQQIHRALRAFKSVLKHGGTLFLHVLNYDKILSERTAILNTKEAGSTKYIRTYDYGKDLIQFNIKKIATRPESTEQSVISIPLRPIRKDELVQYLNEVGFSVVRCFASLALHRFDWLSSKDLVIIANAEH